MAFRVVQHEVKQNAVYLENLSKLSFLSACLHAFLIGKKKNENQVWRIRSGWVLGTEVLRVSKKLATIGNQCMFMFRQDVRRRLSTM